MRRAAAGGALLAAVLVAAPASAEEVTVGSGAATATLSSDPWRLSFAQRGGTPLEQTGSGLEAGGAAATRATALRRDGDAALADVLLADGRTVTVRVAPRGDGALTVDVEAASASALFALRPGEQLLGTGERSDAVDRRGRSTLNYVADGPFRAEDRSYVAGFTPPWATRERDDATYFPVPWVLTSSGWGVEVAQHETSTVEPTGDDGWRVGADAPRLKLVVHSGPTPAAALARFTAATGRQPPPAAPWTFGPWFQTGQPNVVPVEEEREITRVQRDAGAPVSVAETQMHHLPCGAHEERRDAERERTDSFHRDGLARLVYFNPSLCVSYTSVYSRATAEGVLQKTPGGAPFAYPAFVGGAAPLGFSNEPLAQFDFTHPRTEDFYAGLVGDAVQSGVDGWMEDFGESTPPQVVQHDGSTGDAAHNRYPTDYHCALRRIAQRFDRPLVRHQRSGWTGAAACADVVWGGDPTTVWGFDGISSAVTQLLSAGLSGISRWGTDIGGYNSFGAGYTEQKPGGTEDETLTPELLSRWIELGALIPVMRTKRSGLAVPSYDRPQVFDEEQLPLWRRMTELHQALNRYLIAADEEHRRTGLPIARHLVLAHPEIAAAREAHDQYLLGPDLLAAPVLTRGATDRELYVPPGRWVDWWAPTGPLLDGDRRLTLPAPIGRPPLLVRAGALIPLLAPEIDTLTDYGAERGLVRLADRADVLRVLAFPRGTTRRSFGEGASAVSRRKRGRWVLRLRAAAPMRFEVQAALRTMRRPLTPRRVLVNARRLARSRWSYDRATGVLRLVARGRDVRVVVNRRARRTIGTTPRTGGA